MTDKKTTAREDTASRPLSPIPPSTDVRVGWVYLLKKEDLVEELKKFHLDTNGTVEDLRKKLVKFLREGPPPQPTPPTDTSMKPEPGTSRVTSEAKPTASPAPSPTPSRRMPKIHRWDLSFDGRGDPIAFIERLEERMTAEGLQPSDVLPHVPFLLKGEAALWHRNNRQYWSTWEEFLKAFRIIYYPITHQQDMILEIGRRQHRGSPSSPTSPTSRH